jgi:hypothetical protein
MLLRQRECGRGIELQVQRFEENGVSLMLRALLCELSQLPLDCCYLGVRTTAVKNTVCGYVAV